MRSKKNWVKRLAITAGVLYLLYLAVGFFVLPIVVEKNIEGRVAGILDRSVTVEDVDFNPFTLAMNLEGLLVEDDQGGPLFSAGLIRVNAQVSSAFTLSARLKEFALVDSKATVRILEDGVMNFQGLLELGEGEPEPEDAAVEEESKPIAFYIGKVDVSNFTVDFSDDSLATPLSDSIGPISFVTDELRSEVDSVSPYSFVAKIGEEAEIAWSGSIKLEPLYSKGQFRIAKLDLSKGLPYIQELVDVDFAALFSSEGSYELSYTDGAVNLLSNETSVRLDSFSIADLHDADSSVSFESLELAGIEVDSKKQELSVGSLSIVGQSINVVRSADGTPLMPQGKLLSDLENEEEEVAEVESFEEAGGSPEAETPEWKVYLDTLSYQNGEISLLDRSLVGPVKSSISAINIDGNSFDMNDQELESSIKLSLMVLNGSGQFAVNTKGNIPSQSFSGNYSLVGFELASLQAYITEYTHAIIDSGVVGFDGEFSYQASENPTATLNLNVGQLDVKDGRTSQQVAGMNELAIHDIRYDGEAVHINSIKVDAPLAVALNDETGMNLASLSKLAVEEEVEGAEATDESPEPDTEVAENAEEADTVEAGSESMIAITIDTIEVTNGDFRFSDTTFDPDFSIKLDQFSLETSNVSNDVDAKASPYKVTARLDDTSTFDISGVSTFLDFHKETTAAMVLHNFDLTATVPYWRTYLGRHLNKGLLTVESNYQIENGKLDSKNSIRIDQLTLGDKVESEDSLGLPIGFAISLLQDASGVIQIDPPVRGDLEDPSVGGIASIVFKVMGNLIIKAVASPFSLFGGLTGGKEDLDTALVDPGSFSLSIDTKDSLSAIANILAQRPALNLGIASILDETAELEIAQAALTQSFANKVLVDTSIAYANPSDYDLVESLGSYNEASDEALIEQAYSAIDWAQIAGHQVPVESAGEVAEEVVAVDSVTTAPAVPQEEEKIGIFKILKRFFRLAPKSDSAIDENTDVAVQSTKSKEDSAETDAVAVVPELSIDEKREALWSLSGYELTAESVNQLSELRISEAKAYLIGNQAIDPARIVEVEEGQIEESAKSGNAGSVLKFILQ